MKLSKEDIQNFATEDEKNLLEAEAKKREVGELLLSWAGGEEFDWEYFAEELTYILRKKNKSADWYVQVKGFGWRGIDGEKRIEGVADTGQKFLSRILPDTDCTFKIYDYGKNGLAINNWHHDSPTGAEWYYAVPWRYKKDLTESKQLTEKWKDRLQNVYSDFEEFLAYDEIYNLSERLGFSSPEEAWEANPTVSGSVEPKDYKRVKESKQLTEKYASLYDKQVKVLDRFIDKNYHEIKHGGFHFNIDDWPVLYDEVVNAVNPPRETETMWSDINRYVSDRIMNIIHQPRHPWGENTDPYLTDDEREYFAESKQLTEKWTAHLHWVYDNDFEQFQSYDENYGLSKRLGFESSEEAWEANPLITGGVDPLEFRVVKEHIGGKVMDWKTYEEKLKTKSIEELEYMRKDAHEAALAGDDMGKAGQPNNGGYYWDEVHVISAELRRRKDFSLKDLTKSRSAKIPLKKESIVKESIADIRSMKYVEQSNNDLDVWTTIIKEMSPQELKTAEFELQSAIDGINWKTKKYHIPRLKNEYWDEIIERRQLYRKYLNRLQKVKASMEKDSIKYDDFGDEIAEHPDYDSTRDQDLKFEKEDVDKYATDEEKEFLKETWRASLKNEYENFEEFAAYDEIYGLAKRLGFDSAEEAWEANPLIQGGVNPEDYKRVSDWHREKTNARKF